MTSVTARLGSGPHGFFTSVDDVIRQFAQERQSSNVPVDVAASNRRQSETRSQVYRPSIVENIQSIRPDIRSQIIADAIKNQELSQGRNGAILYRGQNIGPFLTTDTDRQRRQSREELLQQLNHLQRLLEQQRRDAIEPKRRRLPSLSDRENSPIRLRRNIQPRRDDGRFASARM